MQLASYIIVQLASADLFILCKLQNGCTALMVASMSGKGEMVMMLLDRGADVNYQDKVNYCMYFRAIIRK